MKGALVAMSNEKKALLGSIAGAGFGTAEMLKVSPYSKEGEGLYGLVNFRNPDRPGRVCSCRVEVVDAGLQEELAQAYLPYTISVRFIQQSTGNWLVAFSASDILASVYMRLSEGEMEKLLHQLGQTAAE